MKYPNRLRVLRAEKGPLSQLDLAIKADIKHYRYWRIENAWYAWRSRHGVIVRSNGTVARADLEGFSGVGVRCGAWPRRA